MPEFHSRFEKIDRRVPIDEHNCAVQFDVTKCKNCTLCRRACADTQTVLDYYSLSSTGDMPICVHCGQCSSACPFGAIVEVNDVDKVKAALKDPEKIVIFQTAPAVRVGLGEAFGMDPGSFVEGKMVAYTRCGLCLRYRFRCRPDYHGRSDGTPAPPAIRRNSYSAVHQLLPGVGRIC